MIKIVVEMPTDQGEFETVCEREYDENQFVVPEPRQLVSVPSDDDDDSERYFVENVAHHLGEDQPEIHLYVRTEEEVLKEVRQQRRQKMKQMQQMQQAQQGGGQGGGNPFSGGGKGGDDSPFTL